MRERNESCWKTSNNISREKSFGTKIPKLGHFYAGAETDDDARFRFAEALEKRGYYQKFTVICPWIDLEEKG